jgi:hypothetical protein
VRMRAVSEGLLLEVQDLGECGETAGLATGSAVTRFQASAFVISQASPRMGSQIVKKLHGVTPVKPLLPMKCTLSSTGQKGIGAW